VRPESHRIQIPEKRCGNCRHGLIPEHKNDLLCFFGDRIVTQPSFVRDGWDDVLLDGEPVGLMDGDEYDHVWGGRAVDDEDVCDEWWGDTR
jgi:hypothetical protein